MVAGVNPRKAGSMHLGRPIFASSAEAAKSTEFDVSLMFVPPLAAKSAAVDACEAGAKLVICLAEHIPAQDVLEMLAAARANGAKVLGPNTSGLVTPGETFAGIMPAFDRDVFRSGNVGVVSRSGSLGTLVCLYLSRAGFGQSAFLGVGGDPVVGMRTREALQVFEADDRTKAVVVCGEIGGTAEEEAAEFAASMGKPVVAFIAGRSAPAQKRMGHAGAIATGSSGSYESKRTALESNGVAVADLPAEVPGLLNSALGQAN